jgi:hypothetical protein
MGQRGRLVGDARSAAGWRPALHRVRPGG